MLLVDAGLHVLHPLHQRLRSQLLGEGVLPAERPSKRSISAVDLRAPRAGSSVTEETQKL